MVAASTADQHTALAVESRRRLLDALRSTEGPRDVPHLAALVGLHATTVRFHLDVLEQAGLVRRSPERANRPGRPRQLYAAVLQPEAEAGHQQLAQVLAGELAADATNGPRCAEQAGHRWAEQRVPIDAGPSSWEQGTRQVRALFERLGFAPRLTDERLQRHLELHACPFREVARVYPQIVCSAHRGLLREALHRSGVPGAGDAQLRPFVEPELCIADIIRPEAGEMVV